MKFFRIPEHRQLLKILATARRRSALTPPELAERVSASRGFVLKYESGERGPIVLSRQQPRPGGQKKQNL